MSVWCGDGLPPRLPAARTSASGTRQLEHARIDEGVVHDHVGFAQRMHGHQA